VSSSTIVPARRAELPLQPRRRPPVLGAYEVGRWSSLPGGRSYGLGRDLHALPSQPRRRLRLRLDVTVAVLQERLHEQFGTDAERACLQVDVEERRRSAVAVTELGQALPRLGQVTGHENQVAHRVDARGRLGDHDPAVAVRDYDGRLVAARQDPADRRDVLGQPGTARTSGGPRLPAARKGRCHAGHVLRLQQLSRAVPPPRPVLHERALHEDPPSLSLLWLVRLPLVPVVT